MGMPFLYKTCMNFLREMGDESCKIEEDAFVKINRNLYMDKM